MLPAPLIFKNLSGRNVYAVRRRARLSTHFGAHGNRRFGKSRPSRSFFRGNDQLADRYRHGSFLCERNGFDLVRTDRYAERAGRGGSSSDLRGTDGLEPALHHAGLPLGGGSNATQTFAVRGPDPTETLVDIDGHYVNNGNTGDFDLSLIDPAALQDVQIVYGISPSSLIGPNTIGGGINIVTLQPTATPHGLVRLFGGSYGTYGGTVQATGTADGLGYAISLHGTSSDGSVNQNILAPSVNPPSDDLTTQTVGSAAFGNSILTKLRYQLGGPNGYGYLQFNFRNQNISKDESALLTTYTPPGFTGGGGDDARSLGLSPQDDDGPTSPYQSFAGTYPPSP